MNNRIPLKNIDKSNQQIDVKNINDVDLNSMIGQVIIDATNHNPAVRLASGLFQKIRRLLNVPLLLLFILSPWLTINNAPVLQMDLSSRQLHLFGFNFWPDDLMILAWVAMASAFALFTAATFAGRLWCGFTCPQTVWTMMFIWIEEKVEGSRNQRLKQQQRPLLQRLSFRLLLKHTLWLILAFATGFTFVAFFETGPTLFKQLITGDISSDIAFWLVFFTALTYINAGWLREQVCLHMCPYARFQSVMLDNKSLKVSYDKNRGEPRTSFTKSLKNNHKIEAASGSCIDCQLCVQVCPVGIDIRQGMQYACIDCGACIDACDEIMEQIQQPKGLIRFSNERNQHWTELFKNRKRLLGYSFLTMVSVLAFILQVNAMETFDAHLTRDRGQLFFYSSEGHTQNAYVLKLHNKTSHGQRYKITAKLASTSAISTPLMLNSDDLVKVSAGERKVQTLLLSCHSPCDLKTRSKIQFTVQAMPPLQSKDKLMDSVNTRNFEGETVNIDSVFFNER